jgi:hypothetical protein
MDGYFCSLFTHTLHRKLTPGLLVNLFGDLSIRLRFKTALLLRNDTKPLVKMAADSTCAVRSTFSQTERYAVHRLMEKLL